MYLVKNDSLPYSYSKMMKEQHTVKKIYEYTKLEIKNRKSLSDVHDFTEILDSLDIEGLFYDPVHVTFNINEVVAKKICKVLSD
jgi:hypothetical protein